MLLFHIAQLCHRRGACFHGLADAYKKHDLSAVGYQRLLSTSDRNITQRSALCRVQPLSVDKIFCGLVGGYMESEITI